MTTIHRGETVDGSRLVILIPVYNDWRSAHELVHRVSEALPRGAWSVRVLFVDDGSRADAAESAMDITPQSSLHSSVVSVDTLRLRRNMGHQRAIALGLAYIQQQVACDAVAVMDADGEDTPEGLVELLRRYRECGATTAVFAARARRSESIVFRLFYGVFKALHWCLTGIGVRIGNFSVLPRAHLDTLVVSSDLWNHYAATVFRSRLPFVECPVARGVRIAGSSSMSFVALVSHGLGAISVFSDIVGVRALIASLAAALLAAVGIAIVLLIRVFTPFALPVWASYVIGALAILTIQFISIAASFTFFTLSNRASLGFVPVRDYALFVGDVTNADLHA